MMASARRNTECPSKLDHACVHFLFPTGCGLSARGSYACRVPEDPARLPAVCAALGPWHMHRCTKSGGFGALSGRAESERRPSG